MLLLSLGATLLFVWVIGDFVLALVMAAVLAALAHPFYRRLLERVGGRRSIASGLTVMLSLALVIVPLVLFLGVVVGEAMNISDSAAAWLTEQAQESGSLRQQIEQDPTLKKLLPYQDEILDEMLRFTPLSPDDKVRLFRTFASVGRATIKGTLIIGVLQGGLAGLSFPVPSSIRAPPRHQDEASPRSEPKRGA